MPREKITRNGKQLFKISNDLFCDQDTVVVNAIVDASFINEAKQIALEYVKEFHDNKTDTLDKMLPIKLSPTGQEPATHYLCSMTTDINEGNKMVTRLSRERGRGKTFCDTVKRNKLSPKILLNNKFVIVECEKQELLDIMGLKEIL